MTLPAVTILEAMAHPALWALWFRDSATSVPWRAFLAALFGLPMTEAVSPSTTNAPAAKATAWQAHRRCLPGRWQRD